MKTCIRAPVIEADDFASLSRMSNFNQFQTDRCRKLNVQCDASVTIYIVSSEAKTAVSPCFFMHFFTVSMAIFNRLSRARNWRSDNSGATGSSFVALRNRSLRGVFCLLIDWKRFHVDWRILKKKKYIYRLVVCSGYTTDPKEFQGWLWLAHVTFLRQTYSA